MINDIKKERRTTYICPKCNCTHIIKFGKSNNIQRYRCKNPNCNHTFTERSITQYRNSKKFHTLWYKYLSLMQKGATIRVCAKKLKISIVTSFFWRHKILNYFFSVNDIDILQDYIELTKLITRENFKGSRHIETSERRDVIVVSAVDNKDSIISEPISYWQINVNSVKNFIVPKSKESAYYNAFSDRVLSAFSRIHNGNRINTFDELDKFFSIKIPRWSLRFHGIATKYLEHYLQWYIVCYKYSNDTLFSSLSNITTNQYYSWRDLKACTLPI